MINPGARQAGDAAQVSSEAQKALADKLMALQERILGFVTQADKGGMFDPNKAAEQFNTDWQNQHGQDLAQTSAAYAAGGYKPGDSEVSYGLNKEKAALDQARFAGMEHARQDALNRKIGAYQAASPNFAGAGQLLQSSGQFGIEAGQLNNQANQNAYQNFSNLYNLTAPWLRGHPYRWSSGSTDQLM